MVKCMFSLRCLEYRTMTKILLIKINMRTEARIAHTAVAKVSYKFFLNELKNKASRRLYFNSKVVVGRQLHQII